MEAGKHTRPDDLPNDIMLSSAEDLNIDGSFAGGNPEYGRTADDDLTDAVADVLNGSEPDDAPIDTEYTPREREERKAHEFHDHHSHQHHDRRAGEMQRNQYGPDNHYGRPDYHHDAERAAMRPAERPVMMMPENDDEHVNHNPRPYTDHRPPMPPKPEAHRRAAPAGHLATESDAGIVTAESYRGINKMALMWMIMLTIILGGVVGIMIYAFILDRIDSGKPVVEPQPDASVQENLNAVAGALEVYLTEVNLNNYNTDIVLVNGGGTVKLTGTLKHTVFVNSTSAVTILLNGVTIDCDDNAALVNLGKSDLTLRLEGMNTLLAAGGEYNAALYSVGPMNIKGDGQVMIYSSANGSKGIVSKEGYQINGGSVVALARSSVERPKDESTQAYFAKDLPQLYKIGTVVSATTSTNGEVVNFTAPGDFSSIFVSNSKLKDGVEYRINIGNGENKDGA